MNGHVIRAIVLKDLREFPRNPYWVLIGPVVLILLVVSFWLMPDTFAEAVIEVGVFPRATADSALAAQGLARLRTQGKAPAGGLVIVPFESEDHLRAVVSRETRDEETRNVTVGIAFPDDFVEAVRTGKQAKVRVYLDGSEGMGGVVSSAVREVAYALQAFSSGKSPVEELPVALPDVETVIVGRDRGGDRVPGEKRRPATALMALFFGLLVIAGLTAREIEHRTVTAILVTPATAGDFLVAKALTGVILGATESLIFLLATWSYGTNWPAVIVVVLLGAVMVSAIGMIAGAAGKGFAMTLFYGVVLMTPLMFPINAVLQHTGGSLVIRAIPSYGIMKGLAGASLYGQGCGELAPYMCMALAWDVVLLGVALVILRKRVEAL
ncbi:MAG: ABC transporter permease [Planctomycetota bacterium]|jgi:ABC-type Na+ efflux pump permease subunit